MRMAKGIISAVAGLTLAALPESAIAVTAHNSQAGSYGSTKNSCAATPYFPADSGCLGSYVQRYQEDGVFPPPDEVRARYRPRRPLQ